MIVGQRIVVHIRYMVGSTETKPPANDLIPAVTFKGGMGMQQAHISALQTKHAGLDARIAEESQRPAPDMTALARLKKEKLRLKEEIEGLH
jgi:hypothetical protein